MKTRYRDSTAYQTRDGSTIRELMHPERHANRNQSLAEATIEAGGITRRHRHRLSEELYHVTAGQGRMYLDEEVFEVGVGDTVLILPGTAHAIENTGLGPLRILCCCAPPYSHADTELLD